MLAGIVTCNADPICSKDINVSAIKADVIAHTDNFTALLNRFSVGDSTLTNDEMAVVYYGYKPEESASTEAVTTALDEAFNKGDYSTAYVLADAALKSNAVSLDLIVKALVSASYSSDAKAKTMIPSLQMRYSLVSEVILSSGSGVNSQSPFIVNSKSDEYRILRNVLKIEKLIGYSTIAGIEAAKFTMPDSTDENILYFKVLK
jgi:hypothetical protein